MAGTADGREALRLATEYFNRQDERFVETLRDCHRPAELAALTDRWTQDERPWARQQMVRYLERPWDRPGHQPVVKRLFKSAEQRNDNELMAVLLVGLDRLIRRERRRRYQHDPQTRQVVEIEALVTPRDTLPADVTEQRTFRNPRTGRTFQGTRPARFPDGGRLFSYHTRQYLRRRVWRYFRRMAYQRPHDYPLAVARALVRYRDEDLRRGENILDSRSLVQIAFGRHDALEIGPSRVRLRPGRSLADLTPATRFAELWQRPEALDVLLMLLVGAGARLVRVWSRDLLRRDHQAALAGLHPDDLLELLDHADEEVQQFGAELFAANTGLGALPLESWRRFLLVRSLPALETICQRMPQHIRPEQLSLDDCLDLACAEAVPVARLGLEYLQAKPITTADEREALVRLADARCEPVAGALAGWAMANLGAMDGAHDTDQVMAFFDSPSPAIRDVAWEWLMDGGGGYGDPVLWSRLVETPYEDLRLRVVTALAARAVVAPPPADALVPVWCAVLAGVERGGRQKRSAIRQLRQAIERDPARAAELLAVLAVPLRSVRAPELREALTAVVTLAEMRPELVPLIERQFPELRLAVP